MRTAGRYGNPVSADHQSRLVGQLTTASLPEHAKEMPCNSQVIAHPST